MIGGRVSKLLTPLRTEYIEDRYRRLVAPLIYYSSMLDKLLIAPIGMVTDYESVPRIPFIYAWLSDTSIIGGVLHDRSYRKGKINKDLKLMLISYLSKEDYEKYGDKEIVGELSKEEGDLVYVEIMEFRGNSEKKVKAKYLAVKWGGKRSYHKLDLYASYEEVIKIHRKKKR